MGRPRPDQFDVSCDFGGLTLPLGRTLRGAEHNFLATAAAKRQRGLLHLAIRKRSLLDRRLLGPGIAQNAAPKKGDSFQWRYVTYKTSWPLQRDLHSAMTDPAEHMWSATVCTYTNMHVDACCSIVWRLKPSPHIGHGTVCTWVQAYHRGKV